MVSIAAFALTAFAAVLLIALFRGSASSASGTLGLNAGNISVKRGNKAAAPRNRYRAISIAHGECACKAVRSIGSKRYLAIDKLAPALPVPGCDAVQCNCKYVQHEDRRKSREDRRHPHSLRTELYDRTGNHDRRERKRGRRNSDWV